MECPSCNFHNTPGMAACLRCGTRLDLSAVAIEPPRASKAAPVRAFQVAMYRALNATAKGERAWGAAKERIGFRPLRSASVAALVCSAVPGGGQLYLGQRWTGRMLLAAWGVCFALWVLTIGTDWQWLFTLGLVGTHSLAINLLLQEDLRQMGLAWRIASGLAIYLTVVVCVYVPAAWVLNGVVQVRYIDGFRARGNLRPGDALLITGRWNTPREFERGDLVYFQYQAYAVGHAWAAAGLAVDRVLGQPGDHVEIRNGEVFVNASQSPSPGPVAGVDSAMEIDMRAPGDRYIIVPSLAQRINGGVVGDVVSLMKGVSQVPREAVLGKVLWRVRPFSRMGRVD